MLSNEPEEKSKRALHHFIIRQNFNLICDIKLRKKLNNIYIYYTDVALPVGLMKCKYEQSELDHIQVNMYLPYIPSDDDRPTFVLKEQDKNTNLLYKTFDNMI